MKERTAARRAADIMLSCRTEAAELFHVPSPEQVVLTFNATHGLNIALASLVKPGDRVVLSGYEHNAVTRPLAAVPDLRVRVVRAPERTDENGNPLPPEISLDLTGKKPGRGAAKVIAAPRPLRPPVKTGSPL